MNQQERRPHFNCFEQEKGHMASEFGGTRFIWEGHCYSYMLLLFKCHYVGGIVEYRVQLKKHGKRYWSDPGSVNGVLLFMILAIDSSFFILWSIIHCVTSLGAYCEKVRTFLLGVSGVDSRHFRCHFHRSSDSSCKASYTTEYTRCTSNVLLWYSLVIYSMALSSKPHT